MSLTFSSGQVENPDTHLRLAQSFRIIEDGRYGLSPETGEDFHGNIAYDQFGQKYMVYNPGQSTLFLPITAISRAIAPSELEYRLSSFFASFLNFIVHSLGAYLLYLIGNALSTKRYALMMSAVFLVSSYSFSFAQSTYEHHYEMLCVLAAFWFTISGRSLILAGIAISVGIFFRTSTVLVLPAILILVSINWKDLIPLGLGLLPGLCFILIHNYFRFGSPLESGYSIAWSLAHPNIDSHWEVSNIPSGVLGLLVSPGKGLLVFSLTAVFGFIGVKRLYKLHKRLTISILVLTLSYLGFYSANFAWHGSIWSIGPRYILPILPFLYLPLIFVRFSKRQLASLLIVGFLSQTILMSVNYKREILEQHVEHSVVQPETYIYDFQNVPYLFQLRQLIQVIPKNTSGELRDLQMEGVWKKEVRKGENSEMLKYSIEKNSINFWWVRLLHWDLPTWVKATILSSAFALALFIVLWILRRKWQTLIMVLG